MDWQDFQNDPLDELLLKAQWPAVQPEQMERIELGWKRTIRRRSRIRNASVAGLTAISAACLIAIFAMSKARAPAGMDAAQHQPKARSSIAENGFEQPQFVDSKFDEQRSAVSAVQIVREPDAFELALSIMHQQQVAAAKSIANATPHSPAASDPIAEAIERLTNEPNAEVSVVAELLSSKLPNAEAELCRWLQRHSAVTDQVEASDQPSLDNRRAAIRLLAAVATPQSEPILSASLRDAACPIEVFQAIAQISTAQQVAARAKAETLPERQQIWISELLKQHNSIAVAHFLELVNAPATSQVALSAVTQVSDPPIDILFAAMNGPRVRIRESAARALGTISNTAVSQRLVEMIANPATRREALIGLMSSSDEVAQNFLLNAQKDMSLVATVRAISHRFFLSQLIN